MHVLLIGAELEENLALRYLGAALSAGGHTVAFATFDRAADSKSVVATALGERPGVIGLSMTFQFRAQEFGALAADLRAASVQGHITVGGHFPTFAHREVLASFPAIDSVVRHEGEETLVELCNALARGDSLSGIKGLTFRAADGGFVENPARPLIANLDGLPFPMRFGEPQLHLGIPAAFLVGSRGCFGHCTFCCIHAYLKSAGGPMYRMRSAENIADEMAELRRTRGARMFVFHDDDFFVRDHETDLARVTALHQALERRGVDDIGIVVKARPDDVDPRVFDVLEKIGLLRVYLGVEAGSTRGLKVLGRGVDLDMNHRALDELRRRDVYTCFNMLVFDPECTLESLGESFQFLRRHASVPMNFCRAEIYVGTPLMTKLSREGRLNGDVFGWDYQIRDPRAERAFRIFAEAFLDRNFRCDGLMNSSLGLGYQLHLLRRFYPRALSSDLRRDTDRATERVNLDCVNRMEKILAFAGSKEASDPSRFADFTAETTREVEASNRVLESMVAEATDAIVRAVVSPRRQAPSRSAWGTLSAAALVLLPLGCEKAPPPPDPLPEPVLSHGPPNPSSKTSATATATETTGVSATATATIMPPDPLPPPVRSSAKPRASDSVVPLPPPDPPPPPVTRPLPPPPDPLPRPIRH
ncbi:MAG: radical SAM protein [Polyangiaceae bacterium]